MIEVFKQLVEALKISRDQNVDPEYAPIGWNVDRLDEAIQAGRQAIAELESQEPVAWMHIMDNTEGIKANGAGIVSITQKRKHPFGKVGIDFSKSYLVTSTPLYTHPPQRKPLTDEEIQDVMTKAVQAKEVSWLGYKEDEGRRYTIPVLSPYHFQIVRAIEAVHGIKE